MNPRQKELLLLCDYHNPPCFTEKDDLRHLKALERLGLVEHQGTRWRRTAKGEDSLATIS